VYCLYDERMTNMFMYIFILFLLVRVPSRARVHAGAVLRAALLLLLLPGRARSGAESKTGFAQRIRCRQANVGSRRHDAERGQSATQNKPGCQM
jgi:hypothetical protein